ncbi:MAG: metallophosphoesterase [Pseudohongiellaceae bacterium]
MRFFALSDVHVDYPQNLDWIESIEKAQYQNDVLLLAGDITDDMLLLRRVLSGLVEKFAHVLFVPGNHELWLREEDVLCSLEKFELIHQLCNEMGVKTGVSHFGKISVVPLYSWYDFSFGEPTRHLLRAWRDFRECKWPDHLPDTAAVCEYFLSLNADRLGVKNDRVISFSHFLPRLDLMPDSIPTKRRIVYPVLGSSDLGEQVIRLNPDIHVYGHSHVNRELAVQGIRYVNNAFAYPSEDRISRKRLHCLLDDSENALT